LTSLEDIQSVMVRNEDGSVRKVSPGEALRNGDSFQTGTSGTARISFHEGSEVLVGQDTIVTIGEQYATATPGTSPVMVPEVKVEKGEVRAMVNRESDIQTRPKASWFRFFVRTPSAVLGVRGTDFVVSVDSPQNMEVHTLSGEVDAAADPRALRSFQAMAVPAGSFSNLYQGKEGRAVNRPRSFDMNEFLSNFHSRHPKLEKLWKGAVDDRRTGRLLERFRGLRNERREKRAREAFKLRGPERTTAAGVRGLQQVKTLEKPKNPETKKERIKRRKGRKKRKE
jgi:hypothetical protein